MDERTQISHAEFTDERPSSYHLTFLIQNKPLLFTVCCAMSEFLKAITVLVHCMFHNDVSHIFTTKKKIPSQLYVYEPVVISMINGKKEKKKNRKIKKKNKVEKKRRGRQQLSRTDACNLAFRALGALIDRLIFTTASNLETDM